MLYTFNMIFKNLQKKLLFFRNLSPKTYYSFKPKGFQSLNGLQPSQGFTLVEMLVVISIMGILYLIVFGSVSDSKARGRDTKRIADIGVIQLALERYYDEFKKYPEDLDTNDDGFFDEDTSVPIKDTLGNAYKYNTLNSDNTATCFLNCQSYHLGAILELKNNVLDDDDDLIEVSGDFSGADTSASFMYDVVPKF